MACSTLTARAVTVDRRLLKGGGCRSSYTRRTLLMPHATASPSLEPPPSTSARNWLAVEHVTYEGGAFTARGKLLHAQAHPDLVWDVLTDYSSLSRVFRNVVTSEVQRCPTSGGKQLVQDCRWQFLLFGGTFRSVFDVSEDPEARRLSFSADSAFMRQFVGAWEVERCPATGGSAISHQLLVAPQVSPPQRVGDLSKQIFVGQVESILADLQAELDRLLLG